jgi:type IV pilus assembly protein PilX
MTRSQSIARQDGFSLVIVLVFMLVLIMIGITGMQASGLDERMAGHSRDRSVALQAAEATLRVAENKTLSLGAFDGDTSCANGVCAVGFAPDPLSYAWNDTKSVALNPSSDATMQLSTSLAANPRYYLEFAGLKPTPGAAEGATFVFRATAHAVGQNVQTSIGLQSTYAH